jgi:hypothetical protein
MAGGILCDAWCSPVWFAEHLPSRFGASVWQQWQSCFRSIMWCGDAFYGVKVQHVEVLILLCALFLLSVAPVSQHCTLIHGVHTVCFCALVAILDPLDVSL